MAKFQHKYRVESARLPGWDYRNAGWYFVTMCTKDHQHDFGHVLDYEMYVSPIGLIAAEELWKTPHIRANVGLDAWVVMPNHIHAIIVIHESPVETPRRGVSTTIADDVESENMTSGLQSGSLGAIIGQFKSICTKRIRESGYADFAWQPRFYDHIIRDEVGLERICAYIRGNPAKWHEDRYYHT